MNEVTIFKYNGSPITFNNGETRMVNATEMAKVFGKAPKDWLVNKSTREFLDELSVVRRIPLTGLVEVKQGGNEQGTWMHEDVALEFARWLSPKFAIWCNDRIKELVTKGSVSLQVPQTFREALLLAAEQQARIEEQQKQIGCQQEEIVQLSSMVTSMQKKVTYMDVIFACQDTVKVSTIAQDYGMRAATFNSLLKEHKIQWKCGDTWILCKDYLPMGYVKDVPFEYTDSNGRKRLKCNTQWTQKGRAFLYEFLKARGILPRIEQQ